MPCRKEWDIGEILLSLGNRKVIEDCMNTSINYRCMADSGKKCVELLMKSKEAYYRDEIFAEILRKTSAFDSNRGRKRQYCQEKIPARYFVDGR